jgi:hypothetical protein
MEYRLNMRQIPRPMLDRLLFRETIGPALVAFTLAFVRISVHIALD